MQLTTSQKNAVIKLFDAFCRRNKNKFSSFKAPTGSGKTFMASEFISMVLENETMSPKKTIFVVATISNAELPKQFARKLKEYKKYHNFHDYAIEYIESPSNRKVNKMEDIPEFVLENNKVFVFGTSSFGKNTIFFHNRTLEVFLQQANEQNYQIIFIRDEAHIGKNERISKVDLKKFDNKMKQSASFVIEMTATPKSSDNLVEMRNEDVNSDIFFLLKTSQEKTKLKGEVRNEEIIKDAIATFKKSKKEYQKLQRAIINPAMLIQIMNDADYQKDPIKHQQFVEGLELLESLLQKAGLKYLKYIDNSPQVVGTKVPSTLEYASRTDSEIDVIIFKIGPATGWDIPRANMLLQIRNVSSNTLNLQTLGRIMRNPYPNLEQNPITDKYYVWSNYQKPTRNEVSYKLKEKFNDEKFISGFINQKSKIVKKDYDAYKREVIKFIRSSDFKNKVTDISPTNDIIYDSIDYGQAIVKNKIPNHVYLRIYNYKKEREYSSDLKVESFSSHLKAIANELEVNIEIVKWIFFSFVNKLKEIKANNTKWMQKENPYELTSDARAPSYYILWKDNDNPKLVYTNGFENYGYEQVDFRKDIQYLDSMPEQSFLKKLGDIISDKQCKSIDFIAKMPSLGSKIFFEYYSKLQGKIVRSFMDFAIKYKGKQIMVEVKSDDEDYDPKKTEELLNAYKLYMEKFKTNKISLVLYKYNKENDSQGLYGYLDNEWKKNIPFRTLIDKLLD